MSLTKPNQQLRRDLKEAAALVKWSGVDLMKLAVRLSEAGFESNAMAGWAGQSIASEYSAPDL